MAHRLTQINADFVVGIVFVFLIGVVSAGWFSDDVVFSTGQKDYYFLVGQEAGIVLNISNDLGRDVSGVISYNLVGPGVNNVQSFSYVVVDGESSNGIGFGSLSGPADMIFGLKFVYEDKEVLLEGIGVHFVEKPEEQKNEGDEKKSSEKSAKSEVGSRESEEEQPRQQSMQQKVSNNQAAQNGQEMKETMNRDAERAEEAKKEFMEELQKNEELAKAHGEMTKEGFGQSGGEINPDVGDSSSGNFKFDYKDAEGNEASLEGRMENGTLTDLKKTDGRELRRLEELIRGDSRFVELDSKLAKKGFMEDSVDYSDVENVSEVRFSYKDEFGNEQIVVAEVEGDSVVDVYWDREREWFWLWGFLAIPVALVSFYFLKRKRKMVTLDSPVAVVKKFNYKGEARKLLKRAEVEFSAGNFKDAYGLANQAIRLYLCWDNGLDKELTNYEILKVVSDLPEGTKEIFDLCCLVEFAKYKPNRKDFFEIVEFGKGVIG
ncbi:MAG: hypothetical protein KJ592_02520 [Nanoarchaeota archaeon]|nr:hypothetical protein [Nanoarchaeota archaeon]